MTTEENCGAMAASANVAAAFAHSVAGKAGSGEVLRKAILETFREAMEISTEIINRDRGVLP
jgi:hypothetical protein